MAYVLDLTSAFRTLKVQSGVRNIDAAILLNWHVRNKQEIVHSSLVTCGLTATGNLCESPRNLSIILKSQPKDTVILWTSGAIS
jgi:hypothetical protein